MALNFACEPFATVEQFLATPCACGFDLNDTVAIQEVIDAASDILLVLSGGRVHGVCTRTVWPLGSGGCWPSGAPRWPYVDSSGWGADGRPYNGIDFIPLRGPNTKIVSIVIDGVALPSTAWRLLDGENLIRVGGSWPAGNDLTAPVGGVGSWQLTYSFGFPIDLPTRYAAIELACELMKFYTTGASALPPGVTRANIQGASVEVGDVDELRGSGSLPFIARFLGIHAMYGAPVTDVRSIELTNGWDLVEVD